jgi:hypothetical protein
VVYRVRTNTGCDHLNVEPCARCEADARRSVRGFQGPRVHTFWEGVYENVQGPMERPVEVTSPGQLREMAHARGLRSDWLDDGMSSWRNRSIKRWI